jgi:hypothetical protein
MISVLKNCAVKCSGIIAMSVLVTSVYWLPAVTMFSTSPALASGDNGPCSGNCNNSGPTGPCTGNSGPNHDQYVCGGNGG